MSAGLSLLPIIYLSPSTLYQPADHTDGLMGKWMVLRGPDRIFQLASRCLCWLVAPAVRLAGLGPMRLSKICAGVAAGLPGLLRRPVVLTSWYQYTTHVPVYVSESVERKVSTVFP